MRYILLNKPYEVLTQFTDETGRVTLKDFVDVPNIYPVGRLDYDSEGLVLLTDDKQLQHRLSEPRFKVPKTYWVQVEGVPTDEALETLRRGVDIKTGFTAPAEAQLLPAPPAGLWERSKPVRFRANIPTSWLEITISQGMNRQVRKMTAAVGFPTLRLVRGRIAGLRVAQLQPGQWRELTKAEVQDLKDDMAAQTLAAGTSRPAKKSNEFWPGGVRPSTAKPGTAKTTGFKPGAAKTKSSKPGNDKTSGKPSRPASGSARSKNKSDSGPGRRGSSRR